MSTARFKKLRTRARTLLAEQKGTVDAFVVRPYRTTDQQRDYASLVCHLPCGALNPAAPGRPPG
jgi:hypothetical protein